MAAALATGGLVVGEPIFHGRKATKGCSAEDFVLRVDNLARTRGWSDKDAAEMAISFLRDEASEWITNALATVDYDTWLGAQTSYITFKKAFKEQFFTITQTSDVSSDWSSLHQNKSEDARQFGMRVAGTIRKYVALLEEKPVTVRTADVMALNTVVQPIRDTVGGATPPTQEMMTALDTGITNFTKKVRDTAFVPGYHH